MNRWSSRQPLGKRACQREGEAVCVCVCVCAHHTQEREGFDPRRQSVQMKPAGFNLGNCFPIPFQAETFHSSTHHAALPLLPSILKPLSYTLVRHPSLPDTTENEEEKEEKKTQKTLSGRHIHFGRKPGNVAQLLTNYVAQPHRMTKTGAQSSLQS